MIVAHDSSCEVFLYDGDPVCTCNAQADLRELVEAATWAVEELQTGISRDAARARVELKAALKPFREVKS